MNDLQHAEEARNKEREYAEFLRRHHAGENTINASEMLRREHGMDEATRSAALDKLNAEIDKVNRQAEAAVRAQRKEEDHAPLTRFPPPKLDT
jgi:hypothetical protein